MCSQAMLPSNPVASPSRQKTLGMEIWVQRCQSRLAFKGLFEETATKLIFHTVRNFANGAASSGNGLRPAINGPECWPDASTPERI